MIRSDMAHLARNVRSLFAGSDGAVGANSKTDSRNPIDSKNALALLGWRCEQEKKPWKESLDRPQQTDRKRAVQVLCKRNTNGHGVLWPQ